MNSEFFTMIKYFNPDSETVNMFTLNVKAEVSTQWFRYWQLLEHINFQCTRIVIRQTNVQLHVQKH